MSGQQDLADAIVMAALGANDERPELLPLETEEELDAYVAGFEQAARLVARALGRDDLIERLIGK